MKTTNSWICHAELSSLIKISVIIATGAGASVNRALHFYNRDRLLSTDESEQYTSTASAGGEMYEPIDSFCGCGSH
ncbi:MAG: hypothetical protein LBQ77_01080 [Treponema sp.]|nr:hypothetical protein [Treponema sp.]